MSRPPLRPLPASFRQLSVRVGSAAERAVIMHTENTAPSPVEAGVPDVLRKVMCILPGPQAKYLPFFLLQRGLFLNRDCSLLSPVLCILPCPAVGSLMSAGRGKEERCVAGAGWPFQTCAD